MIQKTFKMSCKQGQMWIKISAFIVTPLVNIVIYWATMYLFEQKNSVQSRGLFYIYNRQKISENNQPFWPLDSICAYVHTREQPTKWP